MVSQRTFRKESTDRTSFYPRLLGTNGAIACEHHLAAHAGADVLKAGGNAIDAAVAAVLVEGVVDPHMNTIGGECPMILRLAGAASPIVINGNTISPASATVDRLVALGHRDMPDTGVLAAGVPATFAALIAALSRYGTMSFADVVAPALRSASEGFPTHRGLIRQPGFGLRDIRSNVLEKWPGTQALYFPNGEHLPEGGLFRNTALARMFEEIVREERKGRDRRDGLERVRGAFYSGAVADEIDRFVKDKDGLLNKSDLGSYRARIEAPAALDFRETRLFKCGFWNQGPAVLQTLSILKNFDLVAMGHNSVDYVHVVVEAFKLVFADREQYYGDPDFTAIPAEDLLSDRYGRQRAAGIDRNRASGDFLPGDPNADGKPLARDKRMPWGNWGAGTVHVDTIDKAGNMVSATPSGAWLRSSEVIPALGFPLGNRLMTFYLAPANHPNLLSPKRMPRTTISPSLAYRNGKPWMAFGSMGGDQQDQWQLQFFLNRVLFGMDIPEAIEAPKFSSDHCPAFFAPHTSAQRLVRIEDAVGSRVLEGLRSRGHDVDTAPSWTEGFLLAAGIDPSSGSLEAGCDPRGAKSEIFSPAAMTW